MNKQGVELEAKSIWHLESHVFSYFHYYVLGRPTNASILEINANMFMSSSASI